MNRKAYDQAININDSIYTCGAISLLINPSQPETTPASNYSPGWRMCAWQCDDEVKGSRATILLLLLFYCWLVVRSFVNCMKVYSSVGEINSHQKPGAEVPE